jgi:hypothetical protein
VRFCRRSVGTVHELCCCWMIGCVQHVIHHATFSAMLVNGPGVRLGISEFLLEAVSQKKSASPAIHPLEL